jgi:exonuclease SbcD
LAVSHLFVAGGEESESEERPIQMGGAYAVRPSHLPTDVHYIALGHLHKPQQIRAAPVLCRYAGAPLAYSFSETGQAKSVVVLEVEPNSSPQARLVPLSAARPLVRWYAAGGLSDVQLFYRQRTGGANPPEDLVRLFLELVQEQPGEEVEE